MYLRSYESMREARKSIGSYIKFYNEERPHQSLDYKTPDEVHWAEGLEKMNYIEALGQ
ncbi:MAG: integrase core domain-containing protein [Simkaniaceae bacterium]|nr:MAG: integrase core domain-containing protein [Simkaniaceae bacterium]